MIKYTMRFYYTPKDLEIKPDDLLSSTEGDEIDTQLVELILKKYRNDWIVYEDVDYQPWNGEPVKPEAPVWQEDWLDKFYFIYKTTKDRYKTLIKSYNIKGDKLLDNLESNTTTRFNDTPQDGGDFSTDGYTSNISKVNTSIEHKDAMSKLSSIYVLYQNVFKEWVKEFRPIFN